MQDMLGDELVVQVTAPSEEGEEVKQAVAEAIPDTVECIGLYFGAHWAPCCPRFEDNLLKDKYEEIIPDGQPKKFEVVFVSKDGNQKHFNHNFNVKMQEQGWKAIPFSDESKKKSLEQKFGVMEIPMMIITDRAGNQLSENGIKDLNTYASDALIGNWTSNSAGGQTE